MPRKSLFFALPFLFLLPSPAQSKTPARPPDAKSYREMILAGMNASDTLKGVNKLYKDGFSSAFAAAIEKRSMPPDTARPIIGELLRLYETLSDALGPDAALDWYASGDQATEVAGVVLAHLDFFEQLASTDETGLQYFSLMTLLAYAPVREALGVPEEREDLAKLLRAAQQFQSSVQSEADAKLLIAKLSDLLDIAEAIGEPTGGRSALGEAISVLFRNSKIRKMFEAHSGRVVSAFIDIADNVDARWLGDAYLTLNGITMLDPPYFLMDDALAKILGDPEKYGDLEYKNFITLFKVINDDGIARGEFLSPFFRLTNVGAGNGGLIRNYIFGTDAEREDAILYLRMPTQ